MARKAGRERKKDADKENEEQLPSTDYLPKTNTERIAMCDQGCSNSSNPIKSDPRHIVTKSSEIVLKKTLSGQKKYCLLLIQFRLYYSG